MNYKIHFYAAMISLLATASMFYMALISVEDGYYSFSFWCLFVGVWNWISFKNMMEAYHRGKP